MFEIVILCLLAIGLGSLQSESLWLDEFATSLAVRGSLYQALSFHWQDLFVSPIFFGLAWLSARTFGMSEWALRLPAFFFGLFAAFLLYRLVVRVSESRYTGVLSALIFLSLPSVIDQTSYARPYTLCLCFSLAAIHSYIRWLGEGSRRFAACALLCGALAIYSHIIFVTLIPVLLAIALVPGGKSTSTNVEKILFFGFFFLLISPLFLEILQLWQMRADLNLVSNHPGVHDFLNIALTATGGVGIGIALLFYWLPRLGSQSMLADRALKYPVQLFLAWFLVVCGVLFVASWITSARLFIPRYMFLSTPALAALIALIVAASPRRDYQRLAALSIAIFGIFFALNYARPEKREDWRKAAKAIEQRMSTNPHTPLLFFSGWAESDQIERFSDPQLRRYLVVPLEYYGIDVDPILLPRNFSDSRARAYFDKIVPELTKQSKSFILWTRYPIDYQIPILREAFGEEWVGEEDREQFGRVTVSTIKVRGRDN